MNALKSVARTQRVNQHCFTFQSLLGWWQWTAVFLYRAYTLLVIIKTVPIIVINSRRVRTCIALKSITNCTSWSINMHIDDYTPFQRYFDSRSHTISKNIHCCWVLIEAVVKARCSTVLVINDNRYRPKKFREILKFANLSSSRNSWKLKPRDYYQI